MSDSSPFQELQVKMQETHSKFSFNNLRIGKTSPPFASGSSLHRFVGVCMPPEKECFGSYLLRMFSISNGYLFKTVSHVSPDGREHENKTPPDRS